MRYALLVGLLAIQGCAAQMVAETGGYSSYGPVNPGPRGGIIKYLNQGAASVISKRREDAYRQMHGKCNGKYSITREWQQSGDSMTVPVGGLWMNMS